MASIGRRDALFKIAGYSAGMAAFGMGGSLRALPPTAIPAAPMRLSRILTRDLGEMASLSVERRWTIRFALQGRGIVLTGEQTFAKVTAPANLTPIASIEEQRSTADMWPILLSPSGTIVGAGRYTQEADVREAVRTAQSLISASTQTAGSAASHAENLAQMQRAAGGLIDQLPPDLFFPHDEAPRTIREDVDLPGGLSGELAVSYTATKAAGGWLQNAQRSVVTRIGSSSRRATETWEMAAI
ncbi:hypothetical protein [Erythrobacter sp. MTPC3]|uniref:hypothetical protein n=1 Tax=Erythrobacter sp. MTPC3 TaxID=3056564 RepID=UPI0036F3FEE5